MGLAYLITVEGRRTAATPASFNASKRLDVGCLLALWALFHLEADLLAFLERLKTASPNFGEMREEVVAAVVRRDEAEALCVVKPLHSTGCHFVGCSKIGG